MDRVLVKVGLKQGGSGLSPTILYVNAINIIYEPEGVCIFRDNGEGRGHSWLNSVFVPYLSLLDITPLEDTNE